MKTKKYCKIIVPVFILSIILQSVLCLGATITYTDTLDEITNKTKQAQYDIALNAPFSKEKSGINEVIDPETGNLSLGVSFFPMELSDDISFGFSLSYNLQRAKYETENASISLNVLTNENVELTDYEKSNAKIGMGWGFDFPYVEVPEDNNKSVTYVHLPSGSTYIFDENEKNGLSDYKLNDVCFKKEAVSLTDGQQSAYSLTEKSGLKWYFSEKGYLLEKKDRNNNYISYTWSEADDGIMLLSKISDNIRRTIFITYQESSVVVRYKDKIYFLIQELNDNYPLVTKLIQPDNREIVFEYEKTALSYTLDEESATAECSYYPIKYIVYNNHLTVGYEYTIGQKNAYEGYISYLKIKKRYDKDSQNSLLNVYRYSYENEPDGYPKYKSDDIHISYRYKTTVVGDDNTTVYYHYNSLHQLYKKTTYISDKLIGEESISYDTVLNSPYKTVINNYNDSGEFMQIISDVKYDVLGNVLSEDTYEVGEGAGKYIKEYTYHPLYNLLKSVRYKKDDFSEAEILYDVTSDSKNIASAMLKENGSVIKKDLYYYNEIGLITKSEEQTDKNEYLTASYEYTDDSCVYPTRVIYENIENADKETADITVLYEYDDYGNTIKETNGNGYSKSYEYDKNNNLIKEILEDGSIRTNEYDYYFNTVTTTDAEGTKLYYKYDDFGRLSFVKDVFSDVNIASVEYDEIGREIKNTDASNTSTNYVYDDYNRIINVNVTDNKNNLLTNRNISYNEAYKENVYTYISLILSEGDEKQLRKTEYIFDYKERLIRQTVKGENEQKFVTDYSYDYLDNNIKIVLPSGLTTYNSYDIFGNVIQTATENVIYNFEYDYIGNLAAEENGEGERKTYEYNSIGLLLSETTSFDQKDEYITSKNYYDNIGNVLKTVSGSGNQISEFLYDSRGFMKESRSLNNNNDVIVKYTYDKEGRMLSQAYGDETVLEENYLKNTFEYDYMGRLIKETDNLGNSSRYEYDIKGNLLKSVDKNNVTVYNKYDGLDRIIRQSNSSDKNSVIIYSYNLFGELESESYDNVITKYLYDERGNLIKKSVDNPGGLSEDYELKYEYDINSNLVRSLLIKDNIKEHETKYSYDKLNRLSETATLLGKEVYSYDNASRIKEKYIDSTDEKTKYSYYPSGNLRTIKIYQKNLLQQDLYYEYDKDNNITLEVNNKDITEYVYDSLNRIERVTENGSEKITEYEYDSFNNISKIYEIGKNSISKTQYVYDKNNRLTEAFYDDKAVMFDYDKMGNQIYKKLIDGDYTEARYYTYNGYNKLSEILKDDDGKLTEIKYFYGVDGLRTKKEINGKITSFINDGGNVIAEYAQGKSQYYYRGTSLIGYIGQDKEKYFYRKNAHGNIISVLDSTGNEVRSYEYDAFGNQKKDESLKPLGKNTFTQVQKRNADYDTNPFRYCGEYFDEETGNIYLRARYYDSSIGRFITEDPIRDGYNWYVYCGNNPIMFVDSWGLSATNEQITPYPANKDEIIKGIQIAEAELNTHLKDRFSIGKYAPYTYGYKYTSKYYNLVSTKYVIKYGGGTIEFFYSTLSGDFPEMSPEVSSGVSITEFILSIFRFDEKIEKAKEEAKIISEESERYALIPEGASDEWIRSFYITKLNEIADKIEKNKSYTVGEKFIAKNYIYDIVDMCVNYKETKERVETLVE